MKVLVGVVGLAMLTVLVESSAVPGCACASVSTPMYRQYGVDNDTLITVEPSRCVDYLGEMAAVNDGRIYVHVKRYSQQGWLLAADVYLKPCGVRFTCVCAEESSAIKNVPIAEARTVMSLGRGQCMQIARRNSGYGPSTWTRVTVPGREDGWMLNSRISFHSNCFANHPASSSLQPQGCPTIITRAEWGARDPKPGIGTLDRTPYYAFVHHGATLSCHTKEDCIRLIQSYQNYHMDGHGWSDIGYSFVVGEDGNVYEGRGWDAVGAHTRNYNSVGLGICVMGNFMTSLPNQAAQDALKQLIACGVSNNKLTSTYTLLGHRDTNNATSCPGDLFWEEIKHWDHYNSTVIPSPVSQN